MVALLKQDDLKIIERNTNYTTWYTLAFDTMLITRFSIDEYNSLVPGYSEDTPYLANMITANNYRNMGYGKYILTEIMKKKKFILTSYKSSEGFYRKCGLKEVRDKYHYTIFENL